MEFKGEKITWIVLTGAAVPPTTSHLVQHRLPTKSTSPHNSHSSTPTTPDIPAHPSVHLGAIVVGMIPIAVHMPPTVPVTGHQIA